VQSASRVHDRAPSRRRDLAEYVQVKLRPAAGPPLSLEVGFIEK
jgi:hypothetical protein